MEYAIKVEGLTKYYKDFTLDNVSFAVPKDCLCWIKSRHYIDSLVQPHLKPAIFNPGRSLC